MISEHLVGKTCYNLVIIATGSNDITCLDTVNGSQVSLYEQVKSHTGMLCDMAQSIIQNIGVDVFIVENPPRYDPIPSDPTSMKQKLNKYSNSLLSTTLGLTSRLFVVEQGSLARSSVKARNDLYQGDGIHLTTKGLYYHSSNLLSAIQDCYEDTKLFNRQVEDTGRREGSGHHGQVRDRDPDHRPLRYRDNEQNQGRRYRDNRNSDYSGGYSNNQRWRDGDSGQGWNRDQRYPPPGSRARGRGGNRQWDEYVDNPGYGYHGGKKNFGRNR